MTPLSIHLDWLFLFLGNHRRNLFPFIWIYSRSTILTSPAQITLLVPSKIPNPSLCRFTSKLLPFPLFVSNPKRQPRIRRTSTSTSALPCLCPCQCHPYWCSSCSRSASYVRSASYTTRRHSRVAFELTAQHPIWRHRRAQRDLRQRATSTGPCPRHRYRDQRRGHPY